MILMEVTGGEWNAERRYKVPERLAQGRRETGAIEGKWTLEKGWVLEHYTPEAKLL